MATIAVSYQLPIANPQPPLIVITGPTASGKSGLALELAERFGGEIICADSRTIYRGMDVGTAKPTKAEQARVPHHLLDRIDPGEMYSVAGFQREARAAIHEIRERGNVPFLVGGTGLYIDAVVLDYELPVESTSSDDYNDMSVKDLQNELQRRQIVLPSNEHNPRHLVSTLRRGGEAGVARINPDKNTVVVAITTNKDELELRIRQRAHQMFEHGIVDEAVRLAGTYGWESEAMTGNIYPLVRRLTNDELSQSEVIELFVIKDRQLAKRQVTWLKRHNFVQWKSLEEARVHIETILGQVC